MFLISYKKVLHSWGTLAPFPSFNQTQEPHSSYSLGKALVVADMVIIVVVERLTLDGEKTEGPLPMLISL